MRFLKRAVDSIVATGDRHVNVFIVDDGSTDGTLALARDVANESPLCCTVLTHAGHANLGVSASRNLGISSGTSPWVAFLDADDFYLPHRFRCFRRSLAQDESFDALYETSQLRAETDASTSAHDRREPADERFGIVEALHGKALLGALLRGHCWATSAFIVRRSLLERTGLFDPRKRMAEDCDLWFRAAAIGDLRSGDLAEPVSVYWRHAGNTWRYELRNRIAMLQAMYDSWTWARRHSREGAVLDLFRKHVRDYAMRTIMEIRGSDDARRLELPLLRQIATNDPLAYCRWPFLRQAVSVARHRMRGVARLS